MEREAKGLRTEILKICWHMRGGLDYAQAMMTSPEERRIMADMVKEHFETTKKTGLPYF